MGVANLLHIISSHGIAPQHSNTSSVALYRKAAPHAAGAALGYVLSRSVGLPHSNDDIGNWTEPLGLASLFVEGLLVAVSIHSIRLRRTSRIGRRSSATVNLTTGAPRAATVVPPFFER
jgi:hypothetical protein